jgi:hypothetical protein
MANNDATAGCPAKFLEKLWPPAAVVAWIIWRSPAAVKECWGGSLEAVRAKLDQAGPLAHVFDFAMEQLLSVLRQDRVSACGQRDGACEDLTAQQWTVVRLRFETYSHGEDYVTNEEHVPEEGDAEDIWNTIERNEQKRRSNRLVRYDAPGLLRDEVLKAFPVDQPERALIQNATSTTHPTDEEIEKAYNEEFLPEWLPAWETEGKRPPRTVDEKFLKDRFPGLTGVPWWRSTLRTKYVPQWTRGGAPRGPRPPKNLARI